MILVNKPISVTPLQAINSLRLMKPEYKDEIIGYAGRLDPMAQGLLLLLVGDENKKRKEYERLDKEYEFEVLLGIETDSYDILGLITDVNDSQFNITNLTLKIPDALKTFIGTWVQPYPPYSAARVQGNPLYYWARAGKIDEIEIPHKEITVSTLKLDTIEEVTLNNIEDEIITRINGVDGEFRQDEILKRWNEVFQKRENDSFIKLTCTIQCSSGTYVRSIANQIGTKLGSGALAYSIKRTRIGDYKICYSITV